MRDFCYFWLWGVYLCMKYIFKPTIQTVDTIRGYLPLDECTMSDITRALSHPKIHTFETHIFISLLAPLIQDEVFSSIEIDLIISKTHLFIILPQHIDWIEEIVQQDINTLHMTHQIISHIIELYSWYAEQSEDSIIEIYRTLFAHTWIHADTVQKLYIHKSNLTLLRHNTQPIQDIVDELELARDLFWEQYDHVQFHNLHTIIKKLTWHLSRVSENITSLIESHSQLLSIKSNTIMKSLTIVSSIFIPLSFLTWLFGMNFKNMPVLELSTWFYRCMAGMIAIACSVLIYFKNKRRL